MRVAVTGGTGYLGAHTVRALIQAGHEVKLLAAPPTPPPSSTGYERSVP